MQQYPDDMSSRKLLLSEVLRAYTPSDELQIQDAIGKRGGIEAVSQDSDKLLSVLTFYESLNIQPAQSRFRSQDSMSLADLQNTLTRTCTVILAENMHTFNAKYSLLRNRLLDSMAQIAFESGRIIATVTSGPYDRIRNPVRLLLSYLNRC